MCLCADPGAPQLTSACQLAGTACWLGPTQWRWAGGGPGGGKPTLSPWAQTPGRVRYVQSMNLTPTGADLAQVRGHALQPKSGELKLQFSERTGLSLGPSWRRESRAPSVGLPARPAPRDSHLLTRPHAQGSLGPGSPGSHRHLQGPLDPELRMKWTR